MKKLIFLVILAMVLISISKEPEAVSTDLFGLPTAETLKKGERITGFYCLFLSIFINFGVTDRLQGDLEFEGLLYGPFINFKYKILELNSLNVSVGTGKKLNLWGALVQITTGVDEELIPPLASSFHYITISKNFAKNSFHLGIINGWNPWIFRALLLAKDFYWIGYKMKLKDRYYLRGILISPYSKAGDNLKYVIIIGPEFTCKRFFANINAHFVKTKEKFGNALSFTIGFKNK